MERNSNLEEISNLIQSEIRADENDHSQYYELGRKFYAKNKFAEANDQFRKAKTLQPNDPSCHFMHGRCLYKLAKQKNGSYIFDILNESLECFDKAVQNMTQDEAHFHFCKGKALYTLKIYDEALRCFDEALKINNDSNFLIMKGKTLFSIKNYAEAIKCFKKANSINPNESQCHYMQGRALFELAALGKEKDGVFSKTENFSCNRML